MTSLNPKHIAWLIPVAYFLHLLDEYFLGFHNWFSDVFKVDLSLNDFIIINAMGFIITTVIAVFYSLDKINNLIIASLGTLFFINGIVHIFASVITFSYSPGTISGILVYLPLGYIIFKKIFPLIPQNSRIIPVIIGILLQIIVAFIALNI